MHPDRSNIKRFLYTPNKYFEIPDFQRPYSWEEGNVKAFLSDLNSARKTKRNHYFGSIVYVSNGRESTIIDGQQRATTALLMITAIYHLILEDPSKSTMPADQIKKEFLINEFGDVANRIKLRTVTVDDKIFKKIFELDVKNKADKESRLFRAYEMFYEHFQNKDELDTYIDTLEKFEIVDICLEASDDNPQRIFESINSTGSPLTDGDKIRNFALMLNDKKARQFVFDNYWKKIEGELSDVNKDHITDFFKNYLTSITNRDIKLDRVYPEFKKLFEGTIEPTHSDISELRGFYSNIERHLEQYLFLKFNKDTEGNYSYIRDHAFRLNFLKVESVFPFLMKVLTRKENDELSEIEVVEIFSILEALIARRILCAIPATGFNKFFPTLDKDIANYQKDSPEYTYVEILKRVLLEKSHTLRFPRDTEVATSVATNRFYSQRSRYINFILSSIDDKSQTNESFLLKQISTGDSKLSIEHIMPQKLNQAWIDNLGDDFEEIHSQYVDTLPNLTLTGYNSKYSNRAFTEKKTLENGFNDSPLAINKLVKESDAWGVAEIENRCKWFVKQIETIWPTPLSTFVMPQNSEGVPLSPDLNLKSTKAKSVSVFGDVTQVTSWAQVIDIVVESFLDKVPTMFERIAEDEFLSRYIKHGSENLILPAEIYDTGYFVETGMSSNRKRNVMQQLADLLGIDQGEVIFEFTMVKGRKNDDAKDQTELEEQQEDFWEHFTLALKNSDSSAITGFTKPLAQNWLNIHIGTSRAHLAATIVTKPEKLVGIELFIHDDDSLFELLLMKKAEIESKIGSELLWEPLPNKKASRIKLRKEADFVALLENENSVEREEILRWMAEQSGRFAEVFSEYIL